MAVKVAINGFGRIGRLAFRQMFGAEGYEVVAINDLTSPKMLAHLLKYDSSQGKYALADTVKATDDSIIVDGKEIKIYAKANAEELPWGEIGVDVVLECTGFYTSKEKAQAHIKTAMENIVRDDNSTYHTYFFDMETGKPTKGVTCQGNRDGSAWARGQAWGIYGSAVAYSKTGNKEYLDIFKRVTKYFMEHLPKDLVPYWDFDFDTGSDEPRDSSAGVIAVCGMLEMAKYLDKDEAEYYTQTAKRLLKAIIDNCAVKDSKESNGLLLHGTYAKKTPHNTCNNGGVDECNTWGDYFYMEALTRLTSDWDPYWF